MDQVISRQDIDNAKQANLCDVARSLGYTVKRIGNYHTIKEMDSIRIYENRSWYRWSNHTGGSQIDFVLTFSDMDFEEAVRYLNNGVIGLVEHRSDYEKNKDHSFSLPDKSLDDTRIRAYLNRNRKISLETIDKLISLGLIYESLPYHNIVFVGKDADGKPRFASLRGIYDTKPFKCDVRGSDKRFSFHLDAGSSDTIRVFEGAIDLISFYDSTHLSSDHLIALGMTADNPLAYYLEGHGDIKNIILCLDNDAPGISAAKSIEDKYKSLGYNVKSLGSPKGYKDYNEWLVATRSKQIFTPVIDGKTLSR